MYSELLNFLWNKFYRSKSYRSKSYRSKFYRSKLYLSARSVAVPSKYTIISDILIGSLDVSSCHNQSGLEEHLKVHSYSKFHPCEKCSKQAGTELCQAQH